MVLGLGVLVWALAIGLVAHQLYGAQGDGRRQLEQRFEIRSDIAARFVQTYAQEILKREHAQAVAELAEPRVTRREFNAAVAGGGYQAALLLDERGRVIHAAPSSPALIGAAVAQRYEHLSRALNGRPTVSRVVPAAVHGEAVVAFAAPYDTPQGRRVFSGAFDVKHNPIAAYLPSVTSIRPYAVDLVDSDGGVIATTRDGHAAVAPPVTVAPGRSRDRTSTFHGDRFRVAERSVPGTPWRLVVAVPEARLYAPLSTVGSWLAWGGLAIFVIASLLVALLVGRVLKGRAALVADVAQRRAVERELRDAHTRFQRAFDEAPIGLALVDLDGAWRQVNRALCTMLRCSEEELLTLTREQLTHPDDLAADLEQVRCLVSGEADHCELEKRFLDTRGEIVWGLVSRSLVRNDDGEPQYFIAQVLDITERRQFEAKLSHLADHDTLSGLFNRRRFEEELARQVAYTQRYGTPAALLMLDLDNFKDVNDRLGHAGGDELIVRIATMLRARLRETDVVARLGGDEFAIILPETDGAAAELLAGALLETITRDAVVLHERHAIHVSASIGIAPIQTRVALTPAELLLNADVAMYGAKYAGRGRFAVHDPGVDGVARRTPLARLSPRR